MKRTTHYLIIMLMLCMVSFSNTLLSFAQIPSEYLPNSHINTSWITILNTLTELQAYRKTGNPVPPNMFALLNSNFKTVFKYFPNNPSYNLIYKQCDITTAKLVSTVEYDDYNTFVSKCFDPLSNILKDIQSNYTIVSSVKANPRFGQVPLSVTFDASLSSDPSKETIPSDNFFRYFTDTDGRDVTIGKGPIVNYTFTKPGNYVVHNTVRSINNLKGYFDSDNTITITAQPTDTKINILANGIKLDENNPIKLSLSEGTQGVTLDATSTNTSIGKKIIKHTWSISSVDGFNKVVNNDGVPGSLDIPLGNKGAYKITLTTTDNTNSTSSKTFQLILSDPVSKIRTTPLAGTTSTLFSFDGDTSYSVSSRINLYRWDVYDSDSTLLTTSQDKNLRYQFNKPGLYTIKLTVIDQQGLSDSSQIKTVVESTTPVPQFTLTPVSDWADPSQYIFDATSTYDYDMLNSTDKLTFDRGFSDPENIKIIDQSEDQKQINVQFNTKGTHKIKLKVTDSFGKSSEIIKDVIIKSSLRPVVTIDPVAAPWGSRINFTVAGNKNIINYIWNFGDGTSRTVQNNTISHVFERVGVYKVSLTATSDEGEKNTVSALVYIGENNAPIGVYDVFGSSNQLLLPTDDCDGNPAYAIPRYQSITIDSSKSVDTKGQRLSVKSMFKPQNDDIYTTSQLRYKFGELGCQYVEMIVEDKEELAADKKKIRFKVKNGLPRLNSIFLNFPQYQNDVGIGLFQYNAPKDPNFEQFDPLLVRVTIDNPIDLDGSISRILWYYYKPDDPDRLLDIKITPGNSNSVNFALSREAGEYMFGAKIVDNDGGEISSEEIIGKGPSIFIKPKGNDSIDIPLVTLKVDSNTSKVGEEVTFTVTSKILSNRPDFKANRIIKYDFDGDGTDDLTTKDDQVTYVYTSPSPEGKSYKPKAKVIYREKVGIGYAEPLIIKKSIKPSFLYSVYDKMVLIRDTSIGTDDKTTFDYCMDKKDCVKSTIKGQKTFVHTYNDYGSKTIVLTLDDQYGNKITTEKSIELKAPEKRLFISLISTPENKQIDNGYSLDLGKSLNGTVMLYPQYAGTGVCYLDTNLSNGDKDRDLECNILHTLQNKSIAPTVYYKLWYENAKGLTSKIIAVNLLDNQMIVSDQYKELAQKIGVLIDTYQGKKGYDTLTTLLQQIAKNLGDKSKVTEYLIDLDAEMSKTPFDDSVKKEVKAITDELANSGLRAAQGLSEYEQAKGEILAYSVPSIESQLNSLFIKIENTSNKDDMYTNLSAMLTLYAQEVTRGNIDQADYTIIKEQVCKIVAIKEIPGSKCAEGEIVVDQPETVTSTDNSSSTETTTSGSSSLLKWIIWIIVALIIIFVVLVLLFAIKARMDKKKEEDTAGHNEDQTVVS